MFVVIGICALVAVIAGLSLAVYCWKRSGSSSRSNARVLSPDGDLQPGQEGVIDVGAQEGVAEGRPSAPPMYKQYGAHDVMVKQKFGMAKIDPITEGSGQTIMKSVRLVSSMTPRYE